MKYVGVDFSMTSPSVCCINDGRIEKFIFFTHKKKHQKIIFPSEFSAYVYPEYNHSMERYAKVAKILVDEIHAFSPDVVGIEGYAYGAKGFVFDISEATGVFKHELYKQTGLIPHVIAPAAIKKVATGKGNAKKFQMLDAWNAKHPELNLLKLFDEILSKPESIPSPISDMVDAFWITEVLRKPNLETS